MKTVEEMRVAVLAECETVCPKCYKAVYKDGIRFYSNRKGTVEIYNETYLRAIDVSENMGEGLLIAAYRLLGLAERDAIADTKAFYESLFAELKQSDLQLVEIYAQAEVGRLQAEKKNAALVAAAELVIKRNWERINGDGSDYSLFSQAIGNLGDALAANEKGVVQV